MAEQTTIAEEIVSKVAPKRKAAAKRKTTARKSAAKRKTAARKSTARVQTPEIAARAQEAGRNAFLASLGVYGKAYDQAQEQFNKIQDQLENRRKKADKQYQDLVKRGKKVEQDAKKAMKDFELPKLELDRLADRKALEQRLKKARARFEELKESVGFKSVA